MANGDGNGQPDVAVEQFALGDVEDIPAVGEAFELRAGVDGDPAEPNGYFFFFFFFFFFFLKKKKQARGKGDAAKAMGGDGKHGRLPFTLEGHEQRAGQQNSIS